MIYLDDRSTLDLRDGMVVYHRRPDAWGFGSDRECWPLQDYLDGVVCAAAAREGWRHKEYVASARREAEAGREYRIMILKKLGHEVPHTDERVWDPYVDVDALEIIDAEVAIRLGNKYNPPRTYRFVRGVKVEG